MKRDTSGIDRLELARVLRFEYAWDAVSLEYVPEGETSHGYLARERDGKSHFARAQDAVLFANREAVYRALVSLRDQRGLDAIVAPERTRAGRYAFQFGPFAVATFPFVGGVRAYDVPMSDAAWHRAAEFLARLHEVPVLALRETLPVETFDNPFEPPIQRALAWAEGNEIARNDCQRRVQALLRAEADDVRSTLRRMADLGQEARSLAAPLVLTHGDPNLANLIVDRDDQVHVVDWDDLALAPPERDLVFFGGPRFESFLRAYAATGGPTTFHPPIFALYLYRWAVQEIADYSTRIVFRENAPAEDDHAWTELQPCLPLPHRQIARELEAIVETLRGFLCRAWSP